MKTRHPRTIVAYEFLLYGVRYIVFAKHQHAAAFVANKAYEEITGRKPKGVRRPYVRRVPRYDTHPLRLEPVQKAYLESYLTTYLNTTP